MSSADSITISAADAAPLPRLAARPAHRTILSGGLIMLISSILVAAMNFGFNVLAAQRLGPSDFGHVATALTLLLMASSLTLSFQIVCAKFVARNASVSARAAVIGRLYQRAWIT